MNLGNTFKTLLRPGTERETEKKEEQLPNGFSSSLQDEHSFAPENNYQPPSYNFMDSAVFTVSTNSIYYAEPRDFEDAEIITEAIEKGKIVIMRLDNMEEGMDKRVLDFISGYCLAYKILPLKTSYESQWIIDPQNKRSNMR